jgi:hypothetical protein
MTMFADPKYETAKLFLNQIVMSVFGLVTVMATSASVPLTVICAVLGIGLYIFLIYNMMWEIGAKDRIKADSGRYEYKAAKPLKMAVIAGALNFTGGLLCLLALIPNGVCKSIAGVSSSVCKLLWGHFLGAVKLMNMLENPFVWLVVAVFAVLVTVLGYNAGFRGFSLIPALHRSKKDKE